MKWLTAIKNHPFYFSLLLLLGAFAFSRLPFFIWLGLPGVLPDTFDYYNAADILHTHPLHDLGQQQYELPLGYPLFLLLIGSLSGKLMTIVVVQSLIKLFSFIYLAYVSCRYYKQYGILVALAICIYIMNGITIRFDTTLYSESLYSSSLILLVAFLIQAINKNTIIAWLVLGIWLFVPGFIRPNGVYVYFVIPILFFYFYARKEKLIGYLSILIPVVISNLIWASFNVTAYGQFVPGNFLRFTRVMQTTTNQAGENAANRMSKTERLKYYFHPAKFPEFYHSLWVTRYEGMYLRHQAIDTAYRMYDNTAAISDHLRHLVYKDFYDRPDQFVDYYANINEHSSLRGLWLMAYTIWYHIDEIIVRNLLVFIIFIGIILYSGIKWVKAGFRNPIYMLVLIIGLLHLAGIFVVALAHPIVQDRYIQVSEFAVYLTFVFTPLLMKKDQLNAE